MSSDESDKSALIAALTKMPQVDPGLRFDEDVAYQVLFQSLPDVVLILDGNHQIVECNRLAEQMLGEDKAALSGRYVGDLFEPSSGQALVEILGSEFEGEGQSEVSLPDGRTMGFSIKRIDDHFRHLVLREVSPMQVLRTELANTRRMASVGQLAGGIAHEVNNPLAVIQGRIEMLRAVPEMSNSMRERHLNVLEEHCRRVARIVQNLHSFARPRVPDPKWQDMATVLEVVMDRLGRRSERVQLRQQVASNLQIYADRDQLEHVLVNLLNLAIDASADGGLVDIVAEQAPSGAVGIQLQDEGQGLDEELLAELRSPYAAGSAPIDAGRGLLLAVCWGIVQDHRGWLTAEARHPRGSCIQLEFPPPASQEDATDSSSFHHSVTVLVVDDDRVMCETVSWMLTADGHRVVTAHSAEQALEIIAAESFDFVLTDLRLPGMDGEAFIEVLRSDRPQLAERTILTSGLLYRPRDPARYLQKPFTRNQLLKSLYARTQKD